jgi:hypothetical protein
MAATDLTSHVQVINTTYDATPANVGKVYLLGSTPLDQTSWTRAYPSMAKDSCNLSGGNTFLNTGREFVVITNPTGNSALGVDVNDQSTCDHGFDHDPIASVPATDTITLGPFPVAWFTTSCAISYTGGTGGAAPTISVFRLPATSPTPE